MASRENHSEQSENSSSGSPLRHALLNELDSDVFEKYEFIKTMGEGSLGKIDKVRLGDEHIGGSAFQTQDNGILGLGIFSRTVRTGEVPEKSQDYVYALKSIVLDRICPIFIEEMKNEIEILRTLDHPNIVKAYEVYTFKRKIYIIMELCQGGDLFERLPYSEKQAALIVDQLLNAVRYMHDHGVVHRDLKFENVMFASTRFDSEIKIIDFGLSKKFLGTPGFMSERVGTMYTMSPQVIRGMYSSEADLWSIGVMTFMLISSYKPFYHKRPSKTIRFIMHADYSFSAPIWDDVSNDAKDLISHLLVVDPRKRFSAEQAIKHEWIVNRELLPNEIPSAAVLAKIDRSLLNYRHTSELKKLALTVVAHRSSQSKIVELRKAFLQYDKEQNGVVTLEEFRAALNKMDYPDDVVAEVFSSIDMDNDGVIMWTEFLAATIEAHGHIEEDRIAEAFDRLDSDSTGFISVRNLREFLGDNYSQEQLDAIMVSAGKDSEGKISYREFLEVFRQQTTSLKQSVASIELTPEDSDDEVRDWMP